MDWVQKITNIIKSGISSNEDRELLGNSLFYYCSGKDPSPIIAFGADYPLYIFSDIDEDFENNACVLYQRLQKHGFQLLGKNRIQGDRRWNDTDNIILTQWVSPDTSHFYLLYLQFDARRSFRNLYSDNKNYIQPRCICNYRYEFFDSGFPSSHDFFNVIEKRTEYIFGCCFNDKYKVVNEYDYFGDYESGTRIKLYRRMFWYVY